MVTEGVQPKIETLPVEEHVGGPMETGSFDAGESGRSFRFQGLWKLAGRFAVAGALASAAGAAFATIDVFRTPSSSVVGPGVTTEITPTRDGTLTYKVIPDLSIVKPLQGTHGIGASVEVTSMPNLKQMNVTDLVSGGGETTAMSGILGDGEHAVTQAKNGVWQHWKGLWEFGTTASLGMGLAGYTIVGKERRKHLAEKMSPDKLRLAALGTLVLLSSLNPMDGHAAAEARAVPADHMFDGVPFLEGAHLSGAYSSEVHDVVTRIASTLRSNSQAYKQLLHNYRGAIQEHPLLAATPGSRVLMMAANGHCNVYMNPILGTVATDSKAGVVALTSDMVIGGIPVADRGCIDGLADTFKRQKVAIVDGNHTDTELPDYEQRRHGWQVIGDHITSIDGWRFIGASDKRQSLFGARIQQVGSVTNAAEGDNLALAACNDPEGADIVMAATPDAALPTLEHGCAKLGLTGNRTQRLTWVNSPNSRSLPLLEGSNAGGVLDNKFTLGAKLQTAATVVLIKASEAPFEPMQMQVVSFNPDGRVIIGPITPLQPQEAEPPHITSRVR